jgi:hypothetical protein
MTDLIPRARKEWCERHAGGGHKYVNVCPEEVVAALLDVLEDYLRTCESQECVMPCCQTPSYKPHQPTCVLVLALAAITRALEQKP